MSFICGNLLRLTRFQREVSRYCVGKRLTSNELIIPRYLSTGSNQGDDDKNPKVIKAKLEKVAKKIGNKIDGEEGKKTKEGLMKMVSLQFEESKVPDSNAMANIANILKDLPVEVSKKMSKGMTTNKDQQRFADKQENRFADRKENRFGDKEGNRSRSWRDRPPQLDFRNRTTNFDRKDGRNYQERPHRQHDYVNYNAAKPLNLFDNKSPNGDYFTLETWKRLRDEEMDLEFRKPPKNAFDEMIQMTKEGKLWSYPIDNEAGLEEEAKVPFYDHIFLDHLLEGIPESGPVREFIDIMMIGVTNNAFITVERKHAIVKWYVDFFKEKEQILRECGAL
ncbi:28S ribosomal protein S31, mitochondrial-like [Tetranychus urticae]|uniref:Small ribosomal subunit protein mS31 n=2 Tax=Tetranychus urticae TaxID=32264 RepID=T1KQF4_TETUR|nr:28S ribosomal protein S31, mitochondrial-like [Tetranychus urticae]